MDRYLCSSVSTTKAFILKELKKKSQVISEMLAFVPNMKEGKRNIV